MNPQLVTSATGRYATTCRLCGKRVAEAPALDLPIVGNPGKRLNDFKAVLTKHLAKHHMQDFQAGAAILDDTLEFLVLTAYHHEDPSIDPRVEAIRARIFAKVRKNTMADSMIDHLIATIGLDPEDAKKATEIMRSLRDACCEFGQWAPAGHPDSRIVPV